MASFCKSVSCIAHVDEGQDFCPACLEKRQKKAKGATPLTLAERYPRYYKSVADLTEVDVYKVHQLFDIQDPSGAIQHASKKLLLSGARTGGKSMAIDVKEARDTLTRWLQLHLPEAA